MTSPREHFDWAITRAMEYVDMDQPEAALSSLLSDLNKHEGTAGILHPELYGLAVGEYQLAGNRGVRRFIEGLAPPAEQQAGADAA